MVDWREVTGPDGHRVRYFVTGSGPALVMVPNRFQPASWVLDSGYVGAFEATHRLVVLDPVGQGGSDAPLDPAAYTVDATVGRVVAVLDQEEPGPAVLWGYGRAADAALVVTRRRADLVCGLIYGGLVLDDWRVDLRLRGIDVEAHLEATACALEQGDWDAYFTSRLLDIPATVQATLRETLDPRVLAAMVRADRFRPAGFVMPQVPTLAYWGDADPCHERNLERVEMLPVHAAVLSGGHVDVALDVEVVVAAIRPFLGSLVTA